MIRLQIKAFCEGIPCIVVSAQVNTGNTLPVPGIGILRRQGKRSFKIRNGLTVFFLPQVCYSPFVVNRSACRVDLKVFGERFDSSRILGKKVVSKTKIKPGIRDLGIQFQGLIE